MEGEFDRECEEYGCVPVNEQWDRVADMQLAQIEVKHHKKERKIMEKKWSQICQDYMWDKPPAVPLAPKIREMEKKAHMRVKEHEGKGDKVTFLKKRQYEKVDKELREELRQWTKLALTATALSKKKEVSKPEKNKQVREKGSEQKPESSVRPAGSGLYPSLANLSPPPYTSVKQPVQVTLKDPVDVDIPEFSEVVDSLKSIRDRIT